MASGRGGPGSHGPLTRRTFPDTRINAYVLAGMETDVGRGGWYVVTSESEDETWIGVLALPRTTAAAAASRVAGADGAGIAGVGRSHAAAARSAPDVTSLPSRDERKALLSSFGLDDCVSINLPENVKGGHYCKPRAERRAGYDPANHRRWSYRGSRGAKPNTVSAGVASEP